MSNDLHSQLYPANAPADYAEARNALAVEEAALLEHVERVAAQRRSLPLGAPMPDYAFTEAVFGPDRQWAESQPISFYDLVPEDRPLLIYHMMMAPGESEACSMCSGWVDAINGVAAHIRQHAIVVICAKAPIDSLMDYANRRGWHNLPFISTYGTSFNPDLHAESENGEQNSGTGVFVRGTDGTVHHWYTTRPEMGVFGNERGMDQLNSIWNLLDILPAGRGDFSTRNDYALAEVAARR